MTAPNTDDAGAAIYRDNVTTPDTKTGTDIAPVQPEPEPVETPTDG